MTKDMTEGATVLGLILKFALPLFWWATYYSRHTT